MQMLQALIDAAPVEQAGQRVSLAELLNQLFAVAPLAQQDFKQRQAGEQDRRNKPQHGQQPEEAIRSSYVKKKRNWAVS